MTQTRMTTRLPTALADALATRAEANHRSVNGELCAILQAALSGTPEQQNNAVLTNALCNIAENTGDDWARGVARGALGRYNYIVRGGEPLPGGQYYALDGTLMNANGTRSIFDDVDQ